MAFDIRETAFKLPENWKLVRLGDIAKVNEKSLTKKSQPDFIRYIDISSVSTGAFDTPKLLKKDEIPSRAKRILRNNDFIISTVRPNLKQFSFIEEAQENLIASTGFCVISSNNSKLAWYLYSLITSDLFTEYLVKIADGGAYPAFNPKEIEDAIIPLPDKDNLKFISDTSRFFHKKIQLNTQINQTLEQIAQALFKSWFVDFDPVRAKVQALSDGLSLKQAELAAMQAISGKTPEELTALSQTQPDRYAELAETAKAFPYEMVEVDGVEVPKGWKIKPLPEIIDFLEGPGIRNWQYTDEEDGIKFINIRCIQNGDLTLTTANKITKEEAFGKYKHFQLEEDDIVVSTSGTLGRFAFVRKEHLPLSLNTSVIRFRPIKNKSTLGFIAGFVENQLQHELETRASGSAQRNFGPTHLKQISLLVPDFKLLELHQKYASSLFEKRKQLLSEIDVLKDARDLLLPKLLNGEFIR